MSLTSDYYVSSTRPRSHWGRRILILLFLLIGGYLLAAYLNVLPSFIPNVLNGWRPW